MINSQCSRTMQYRSLLQSRTEPKRFNLQVPTDSRKGLIKESGPKSENLNARDLLSTRSMGLTDRRTSSQQSKLASINLPGMPLGVSSRAVLPFPVQTRQYKNVENNRITDTTPVSNFHMNDHSTKCFGSPRRFELQVESVSSILNCAYSSCKILDV